MVVGLASLPSNEPTKAKSQGSKENTSKEKTQSKSKAGSATVPDLTGKTISQAVQAAGGDFEIVVRYVYARQQQKGTIVAQDPDPNEQADEGSEITVDLSGGPNDVRVPDVSGKSASQAGKILIDAGLDPDFDVSFDQNGNPEAQTSLRTITATDPPAGSMVSPDKIISTQ